MTTTTTMFMATPRKGRRPKNATTPLYPDFAPKTPFLAAFGARLHERRRVARINQRDMAARLGVSQNTFRKYESGAVAVRVDTLLHLAEILGCEPWDLLGTEPLSTDADTLIARAAEVLGVSPDDLRAAANP